MKNSTLIRVALGSVVVALVVLGLKYLAYEMTGSIALFSDALESIVNVVTAIATLVAVGLASRPADNALPYGYHKAEYFSAVVVGVFILIAAFLIFQEAWTGFRTPEPFDADPVGLGLNLLAGVINGGWCFLLLSIGRRRKSPALVADGTHLFTDVLSSAGVLVGVILAAVTQLHFLDPLLAALVGLNILWSGLRLISHSVGGLMDISVPNSELSEIKDVISQNADGAIEAHDVRTRQAGRMTFIDFHLVVPADMRVDEAHDICDRLENALQKAVDGATITIHVEPENKAKHAGIIVA